MPQNIDKLREFVEASKSKGASDEFLAALLTRRGWPQDEVYAALGAYWEQATGIALPDRSAGGESSRDAFLYLLSFATLATWSSALGSLLFRVIDHWLPDPVMNGYAYGTRGAVTWQMASIAVAFPIFLFVMRFILQETKDHPEQLQSGVRKWLTYIALLLTAGGVIADLIFFLDYFLTGELTLRFVLKAASVLMICGAIFAYYVSSLRWNTKTDVAEPRQWSLRFGAGSTVAVIAAFCLGLTLAGSPPRQRRMEADRTRVMILQRIASDLYAWHQQALASKSETSLPPNLMALRSRDNGLPVTDPLTKAPYGYRIRSGSTYELCATFDAAEEEENRFGPGAPWRHGPGRTCFSLDASKPTGL